MHVIFGFYEKKIISAIGEELKQMDVDYDFSYCKTKLDVLKCVMEEEKIDALVLFQSMKFDGDWTDYELARLTDGRDINIIPLLDSKLRGTEYMKMLYAAGITSAIIDSVTPREVAKLIVNKREMGDAKKYYGIRDEECYISLDAISDDKAKIYMGLLEDADRNGNAPEVFDNICCELNKRQVESLVERLNYRLKELFRKSNTYKSMYESDKKSTPYFPQITRFEKKKNRKLNLLYGFDRENAVKHIEERLKNSGFVINSSMTKYSKEGIRTYIRNNDVTDAVIIENLEARGGYVPEEVVELRMMKDINIIMALAQKKGSLYLNKLYCSGVLNSIIGNVSVADVSKLIADGRSRSEAREYYGLEMGGIYSPKICSKYKESIVTYLNRGNGKLRDKFLFVETLLSKEQISDVINTFPESLKQALINNEIMDDPDKKKGLFAILENKKKGDARKNNEEESMKKKENKQEKKREKINKQDEDFNANALKKENDKLLTESNDEVLTNEILNEKEVEEKKEPIVINEITEGPDDEQQIESGSKGKETEKKIKKRKPKESKPQKNKNDKKKFIFIIIPIVLVIVLIIVFKFVLAGSDETFEQDKNDDLVVVPEIVTDADVESYDAVDDGSEDDGETLSDSEPETMAETVPETVEQMVEETAVENVTVAEEEITTVMEETTLPEITTKKKKKKKHKKETNVVTTTRAVQTTTEKQTRSLGSYSEKNEISSSKISIIRNSVIANFAGSSSSEKGNLAKYMSANKLSDANGTYRNLTGNSKQFSVKTYSVTVDTASQEDIVKAAEKASSAIGRVSSEYGIGISSFGQTVGYKIYIVVVY